MGREGRPARGVIEEYERKLERGEVGDEQVTADLRTTDRMLPEQREY